MFRRRRAFQSSGGLEDWRLYCSIRKVYKQEIRSTKSISYSEAILSSDNQNKMIWNIVNQERENNKCRNTVSALTSSEFNSFFANIADIISSSLPAAVSDPLNFVGVLPSPSASFFLPPVVEGEVQAAILQLKNSTCTDCYGLNSRLIKAALEHVTGPLTVLFNACLTEGNWPGELKIAKVLPLHKKGDLDCANNFRPISIVPIISKIFEIIINHRLLEFLELHSIISPHQFGFRKNVSTIDALAKVIGTVVDDLDERHGTSAVLCDLAKAFDCVDHSLLLAKMEHYGIRGLPLVLIGSYLADRTQYVSFDGRESVNMPIRFGVPQGSLLGPLMFLIFINDLPSAVNGCTCILYADDTTLLYDEDESDESEHLSLAKNWFVANRLQLNESKTVKITFTSDKLAHKSQPVKLLGLTLDSSLTWSAQIEALCSAVSSQIYALRQLRHCLQTKALRTVYFGTIHSLLTYGIRFWGNSSGAYKVFALQKSAVRIVGNAPYGSHCLALFRGCRILPVPCLYIYETLVLVHKNRSSYNSHYNIHTYGTRNAVDLVAPFSRLRTTQANKLNVEFYNVFNSFYRGLDLQNRSRREFCKFAKMFLLEHCFYSIEDFLKFAPRDRRC